MPVQEQVTITQVLEESLDILYRSIQRPISYALGSNLNATDNSSTFTITAEANTLNVGDILEMGLEQLRVTSIDTANPRDITAVRGFAGSTKLAHTTGDTVLVNPDWYRMSVYRAILRGLKGTIPAELPNVKTFNFQPTQNQFYQPMPADCIRPMRVAYVKTDAASNAQKFRTIDEWTWEDDVDPAVSNTGGLITLPIWLCNNVTVSNLTVYVTYQSAYLWTVNGSNPVTYTSTPSELNGDYILLETGATDLPALYAAAYLTGNREITRLDLQRVEEWSQEAAIRQGNNLRVVQQVWAEFYRRLDETRRLKTYAKHRPFRPMHRSAPWGV